MKRNLCLKESKNGWSHVAFLLVIFLFFYLHLNAQQDTSGQRLEEVIITATRKEERPLVLPYATTTMKAADIHERQPRSLPEALIGLPGVFLQKTNHGGGSPFVRGLTGNQTLTIIDGIRLNNSTFRYGPNQYLNTIDLFTIDKIEVVRGSGSAQYGSDAMGGVIQVFTKDPRFASKSSLGGNLTAKYSTHSMEKILRSELEFGTQKFAITGGLSYKKFGDLWGGDTTGRQSPSGYGEHDFDIKMKYALPRNWILKAAHQNVTQTDVPVYHKVRLEHYLVNKMDPQKRKLSYINLEKHVANPWFNKLLITASRQQTSETRVSQKNSSVARIKEKDDVHTLGVTADISHRISDFWTANSGVEFYSDRVNSKKSETNINTSIVNNLRGLYPDGSNYKSLSFYSLQHLEWTNWVFEGGLRYSKFAISINDTTLGKVVARPSALVANAAILRKLDEQNSLYFSFSKGFRAPNIDDMGSLGIVDFRYEQPAYNLKPEQSFNYELGYKLEARRVYSNIALFYNRLQHLITRQKMDGQVIDGYPMYQKVNNEKAYIWGTDVEVGFNITSHLELQTVTSYAFGQNITKNEPMRRIPPMNKRLLLNYHNEKWFAKAEWLNAKKQERLAQGDNEDNRIPLGGTPGWNVLNVYAGRYFKKLLLSASLQNLMNEDYRTHGSGINGVGRSAWLSARWSF